MTGREGVDERVLEVVDPTRRLRLEAESQALDARALLTADPSTVVEWPWPDLAALLPPMVPGTVHVACAFSGTGKTTLLLSAIDAWVAAGVPIYVCPLETTPTVWRTLWAALRLAPEFPDLDPGDVKTLRLQKRADAGDRRAVELLGALDAEVERLARPPYSELLYLEERVKRLTPKHILAGCRFAQRYGFRLAVFDHLDRTELDAPSLVHEAREIIGACDTGAKEYGVAVLGTKQCNQEIVKGPDRLARYQPPREHHVQYGGGTRQEVEAMFGIFRPLRLRQPDELPQMRNGRPWDPFVERMKAARNGDLPAWQMLMPNVTGINCLKNRPYGRLEGHVRHLGYHQGRNVPLSDDQRRALEAAQHHIPTGGA